MISNPKIAAYQYPATIIVLDDDKGFLNTACFALDEQIAYRLFDNPERALHFLKHEYKPNSIVSKILTTNHDTNVHLSSRHGVNLDLTGIHKEVFNPNRFREIAVIIVDYNMPKMDGLKFCEQLKGTKIKIILVTGATDERIAVKAFNDGIIHKFILKNDPNFTEVLNKSIFELQRTYFEDISEGIIKPLIIDRGCVLSRTSFSEFFYDLCKQHHFAEYYLYDSAGSYMLLDYNGNVSWLVVKSAADLDDYYDLARDSKASATVLEYLKEGKMLPFFPQSQDFEKAKGINWENYLYPAKRLKADQAFFYAFIENKNQLLPDHGRILSFTSYMDRIWPH